MLRTAACRTLESSFVEGQGPDLIRERMRHKLINTTLKYDHMVRRIEKGAETFINVRRQPIWRIKMKSDFASVFLLLFFSCLPLLSGCIELNQQRPPKELYIDAYLGDPEAEFKLAAIYSKGEGVPQSDEEALRWFERAALRGIPEAQYNVGVMHANGLGVERDVAEAARWYRMAAEEGFAPAQTNLGVAYLEGREISKNETEALRWLRMAADQGEVRAQYNLGVIFIQGRIVKRDEAEARRWFRKAAAQGLPEAREILRRLGEGKDF